MQKGDFLHLTGYSSAKFRYRIELALLFAIPVNRTCSQSETKSYLQKHHAVGIYPESPLSNGIVEGMQKR
jgi:hypothetical protein